MAYKRKTIKVAEATEKLQEEYNYLLNFAPGRPTLEDSEATKLIHARKHELRFVAYLLNIDLEERKA